MNETDLSRKRSALMTILSMNDVHVPELRIDVAKSANVRWLQRNFLVNNSEHPFARTVMEMLKTLAKHA